MARPVTTPPGIDPGLTGFQVPVNRPLGAVHAATTHERQNIPAHTELRRVPDPNIPLIDNSNGKYQVIDMITVAAEQTAPTTMPGETPMFNQPQPAQSATPFPAVQRTAPQLQKSAGNPSLLGLFQAAPEPTPPQVAEDPGLVWVTFAVGTPTESQDVLAGFGDVCIFGKWMIFVHPLDKEEPWFPEDLPKGDQVAMQIAGSPVVYLVVANEVKFDYLGVRFKVAEILNKVTL